MSFRKLPKVCLNTMIPNEIVEEVGLKAVRDRKPENAVVAELLCIGLGMDPARFGIATLARESTPSPN
jgi:hypothetical protein